MITFDHFWRRWKDEIPKRRSSDSRALAENRWFRLPVEERERAYEAIPLYKRELLDSDWLQACGASVYLFPQKRWEGLLEDEALKQAEEDESARASRARRVENAEKRAGLLVQSLSTPPHLDSEKGRGEILWLLENGYIDAETARRHGVESKLRRVK